MVIKEYHVYCENCELNSMGMFSITCHFSNDNLVVPPTHCPFCGSDSIDYEGD